jgi:hypothetical protein
MTLKRYRNNVQQTCTNYPCTKPSLRDALAEEREALPERAMRKGRYRMVATPSERRRAIGMLGSMEATLRERRRC